MSVKNLFGRGIGFGGPEWIPTRGYSIGAAIQNVYVIIGAFKDKRPRLAMSDMRPSISMKDKRPSIAFAQPEAD